VNSDTESLIAVACEAADVAGSVIRPFFRTGIATVEKSDLSPVTVADRTAEQAMRALLTERFPDHGVLGEEFGLDRPEAPLRWVLDPIDGTRAFITGRPTFGTLIALFQDDRPIVGIIDQPVTGERWIGAIGRPTVFRGPFGGVAGCRPCAALADAELSCTGVELIGEDMPRWERLRRAVRRNSWGGDCYAHGLVAIGQIDIVAETTMKVWDWGALVPVIEGAGGSVTDWSGAALRPDGDGRVLSAGDKTLLPAILRELNHTPVASG
jgi:histidinol phosphatase-like enzyme (inositol monophosphatase family)